jgi:hypothetical protein
LFFLVAALNDLDVLACDIQNAYMNAKTSEKVWFCGGKEMGSNEGKVIPKSHCAPRWENNDTHIHYFKLGCRIRTVG